VTGAAQGLGQAIALALAERGARVIATDLAAPEETVRRIGPTAQTLPLDVSSDDDWRLVAEKSAELGPVDIVVNNAGFFPNRRIDDLDFPTWRKTMATDLDAHFLSAKHFLPAMRKGGWGNIASDSGPRLSASQHGVAGMVSSAGGPISAGSARRGAPTRA